MTSNPATRTGRSMNLLRLSAVLLFGALMLGPPLWVVHNVRSAAATTALMETQLERLHDLDRRLQHMGPGQTGSDVPVPAEELYFEGATPAVAGAAMQRLVADIIESAGGSIQESQRIPVTDSDGEEDRIEIRVSFDAGIDGLQSVLYQLETGLPLILVRSLGIRSENARGAQEDAADPRLRATLVAAGYQRPVEP